MGRRLLALGTLAVVAFSATGSAQPGRGVQTTPASSLERARAVRWNALASAADTVDDAPIVKVWMEGSNLYSYGAPVRVWFNVSQDAYVIVARVDANGHLTLLYPSSRTMSSGVEGGRDIQVRGRRGVASFYATDRMGGGFVFAMASYDPFDLSRLALRDFDRYVTGTYVGRPSRVYIGDPHRVITRFASLVNYADDSPFDYSVEYYNVDAPYYVSSVGFSNFCFGYGGQYRRGLQERWDDELFYGMGSSFGSASNCGNVSAYCGLGYYNSPWGYDLFGWGAGGPLCFFPRGNQPGQTLPPPVLPPATDSARVPGWLPDSIKVGRPDTVGTIPERRNAEAFDNLRRQTTITWGPDRPGTVDANDPTGRSYAIPGRALRNSPMTFGEGRDRGGDPTARPDRMNPTATGGSDIQWVRPPREVVDGARDPYGNGALPRSPRAGGNRADGEFRGGRTTFVTGSEGRAPVRAEPRYEPPTRTFGPRFDTSPNVRNSLNQPQYAPIPPRNDGPRYSPPAGGGAGSQGSSGGQVRSDPAPAQRSEPVRPAESGGGRPLSTEKKPDTP